MDDSFAAFTARVPVARFYDYRCEARDEQEATLVCPVRPDFLQTEGAVHGGVLATLADTAAVWLLWPRVPADRALVSVEFKLNFLRPAQHGAGDLVARARLIQGGRTVSVCDVEVSQARALVAKGLFTYLATAR
jgi:uncharacterized protein (TIGR00369 family)